MKEDLKTYGDIRESALTAQLLSANLQETQDSVLEFLKFMYEEDLRLRHAEAVKEAKKAAKKAAVRELVITVFQIAFYSFLTTMLLTAIFG